jgi:hypothetical protein
MEALSPWLYQGPKRFAPGVQGVVNLSDDRVPWERQRSRPDERTYYCVILGFIRMDVANKRLIEKFGKDEERGWRKSRKAVIATVLVDKEGILVEENGIAISSFAWGLPLVLKKKQDASTIWVWEFNPMTNMLEQRPVDRNHFNNW